MNANATALQDVYRETVLQHSRSPKHLGRPQRSNREALGFNPLCGDKLTVYLDIVDGAIKDAAFEGTGCAISMASASMMTEALLGQSIDKAGTLINEVLQMLANGDLVQDVRLNDIRALEGVRTYPSRVKCATLAWSTVDAALKQQSQPISTE